MEKVLHELNQKVNIKSTKVFVDEQPLYIKMNSFAVHLKEEASE